MKYIIFILSVLFSLNSVFAQIYVKDNSFIFNKGTVVYANGNLELNGANSNFYLRNEGQFLQGTTSTSTNKGIGKLSVFQEGTVNNFAYNYWCLEKGYARFTGPFQEGEEWKPNPTRDACKALYQQWQQVMIVLNGALDSMKIEEKEDICDYVI